MCNNLCVPYCIDDIVSSFVSLLQLSYADMLKRVDPLRKELKDLETKAEDTRQKGEEITKVISELESSIAKYTKQKIEIKIIF